MELDLRGDIVDLVEEMTPLLGFAPSLRLGAGLGGEIKPYIAEQALAAGPTRRHCPTQAQHAAATQVDVTVDSRRGRDVRRPGHR